MIYKFIDIQKADFPVKILCSLCNIPRSSWYLWNSSGRENYLQFCHNREKLKNHIKQAFVDNRSIYGAPRLTRELHDKAISISSATVGRLMSELGISGAVGRTKIITTRADRHARKSDDLIKRNFTVDTIDKLWVSDLTYIDTKEGWLYLVCMMDAFSRRILGYAMGDTMDTQLFIDALNRAKATRSATFLQTTILHSDHGSQYTSKEFRELLSLSKMAQSMGSVGNSYDNAMAESLWASLKKELVYKRKFVTRTEAQAEIFSWIQWYWNYSRNWTRCSLI